MKMKKNVSVYLFIGLFMVAIALPATNALAVDSLKGRGSIGGALSYSMSESEFGSFKSETTSYALNASLGYFFTDHFEVNFSPYIVSSEREPEGGETSTDITYSWFGNLKYNFYGEGWTVIPYIGIQGGISGYDDGDNSDENFSYGGMGGLKFFLNETVSINLELNFIETEFDEDQTLTDTRVFVGFTYYFGGN